MLYTTLTCPKPQNSQPIPVQQPPPQPETEAPLGKCPDRLFHFEFLGALETSVSTGKSVGVRVPRGRRLGPAVRGKPELKKSMM